MDFLYALDMNGDPIPAEMLPKEKVVETRISDEKFQELEEALSYFGLSRSLFVKQAINAVIQLRKDGATQLPIPIRFRYDPPPSQEGDKP